VGRKFDLFVVSCGGKIAIWFYHETDVVAHGFFLFATWEATIGA
jgi:hypothetical protein